MENTREKKRKEQKEKDEGGRMTENKERGTRSRMSSVRLCVSTNYG